MIVNSIVLLISILVVVAGSLLLDLTSLYVTGIILIVLGGVFTILFGYLVCNHLFLKE